MVTAYFDESGTHQESPFLVVAGYIGEDDQWDRFTKEWHEFLDRHGVDCFHMTDFENRRKQFKGVDENRKKIMLDSATRYIRLRTLRAFACVILKSDYEETIPIELRKDIGGPYHLCTNVCIN